MRLTNRKMMMVLLALTSFVGVVTLCVTKVDATSMRVVHGPPELVSSRMREPAEPASGPSCSSLEDSEESDGEDWPIGGTDTLGHTHPSSSHFTFQQSVTRHPVSHAPLFLALQHFRC